jgi:hypothetical protein
MADGTSEREAMDGSPARVELKRGNLDCGYIKFQAGPELEGLNGTTIETVLEVLLNRLRGFQRGPFMCRENALAITKLEEGLFWIWRRTQLRREQGVEGTEQSHFSTP